MKHYIYIDKEIVNTYISQIYGGILNKEQTEKSNKIEEGHQLDTPEEKIKATVKGGLPGIISGDIETEYDAKEKETKSLIGTNTSKEVVEKIYHDNLLDNLIEYITNNEKIIQNSSEIEYGSYISLEVPFNFVNHEYLNSISNKQFKDAFVKIMNVTSNSNDEATKQAKGAMELISNFTIFFESCFPAKQLIITDNLIIPIKDTCLREDPSMIDFKYGGNIKVIGKVTKDCSKDENFFGLYNKEFGKSIQEVKDAMYKIFLPKYKQSFIITPIALYFG